MAFTRCYRERANQLARSHKRSAKAGLDRVRAQVADDAAKPAALIARFGLSQSIYRHDRWAERATPEARAEGAPLADLTLSAAE